MSNGVATEWHHCDQICTEYLQKRQDTVHQLHLFLGRGIGNGGEGECKGGSHLFTLRMILTMFDVPSTRKQHIRGGLAGWGGCPSGDHFCSVVTQGPSKCLPGPPPHTHSPGQMVSLPQEMASAISKQLARGAVDVQDYLVRRWSGCLWACLPSQTNKQKNQLSTFLIPSYLVPWHPESVLPLTQRPSAQLYVKTEGPGPVQ